MIKNKDIYIKKQSIDHTFIKTSILILLIILIELFIRNVSKIYRPLVSILITNMIIIYIYPNKNIFTKFVSFVYFLILLIFIKEDFIRFSFIPQAKVLLDINKNLPFWFKSGHPHAIRLLVAYPGYILSQIFNIDLDLGFTYYGITMFNLIFLTMMNSLKKLKNNKHKYLIEILNILCMLPLTVLAFLMNGRLISAYLGFLIIIEVFVSIYTRGLKINITKMILLAIAFVLTTVSSGTLMVSLLYIISMLYIYYYKVMDNPPSKMKQLFLLIILSPVIYLVFKYAVIMLFKNINYFGGGFKGAINMLSHGVGRFFILSKFQTILFVFFIVLFLFINYLFIKKQIHMRCKVLPLLLGINISMYGLLFGLSTGLMGIPPLVILILYYIR